MPSNAELLQASIDSMCTELANESARRAALTVAGLPAPTNYSAGGRSVSYDGWRKSLNEAIMDAMKILQSLEPFEIHEHGYSGY